MSTTVLIANGKRVLVKLPCTVNDYLLAHNLLTRSVVVECNGEAVVPSEFATRVLKDGDRVEIVKIVAGG